MVLLQLDPFLNELTSMFERSTGTGSVWVTLKRSSLKSKVVRNKMVTAGEAIEYKCLIRATNGKKTISTSVCISYILNLSFWFISVLLEPSCRVMQVSSTVECKLRLSCEE
ncbi:RNA-binding signal recognition particle subunit srp14 [Stylosanthes scabra]|uniref:Signal recognition particle 14 kDa protein n=1 Tax=Stylosanthes scabra TaxID=79078 RepID=A0ABU6VA65_9FABA|nr:RNA-binding signal recognition particle subunit srp14 [Stylosanthes scabra]